MLAGRRRGYTVERQEKATQHDPLARFDRRLHAVGRPLARAQKHAVGALVAQGKTAVLQRHHAVQAGEGVGGIGHLPVRDGIAANGQFPLREFAAIDLLGRIVPPIKPESHHADRIHGLAHGGLARVISHDAP